MRAPVGPSRSTRPARSRRLGRALALAGAAVVLVATAACSGDEPSGTDPRHSAAGCGGTDEPACFDLGNEGNLYCYVLQVRTLVRTGRLDVTDLPTWAVREQRDGAPIVYDLRSDPPDNRPAAAYLGDLTQAVYDAGQDFDRPALQECGAGLTQEKVRETEGGWLAR